MRLLILGAHSALNLGDDAIMAQTLEYLRQVYSDLHVTIAANDPESWMHYVGPGVEVVGSLTSYVVDRAGGVWRWRRWKVIVLFVRVLGMVSVARCVGWLPCRRAESICRLLHSYLAADRVIVCGGGNLYAHRRISIGFLWLLFSIMVARVLRKPITLLPQSIGPVVGSLQRKLLAWLLNNVEFVMLRERQSEAFLLSIACKTPHTVLPDLAFGLEPVTGPDRRQEITQIGLTVMDFAAQNSTFSTQTEYEDAVVTALGNVVRASPMPTKIFVFRQCFGPTPDQDDLACIQRIVAGLEKNGVDVSLVTNIRDPMALRRAYAEMDLIVGTRMHTAIFAASAGVPVVSIAYQPKAIGTMKLLGLDEYVCDIRNVTDRSLTDLLRLALSQHSSLTSHIRERYGQLRDEVSRTKCYLEQP